MYEIGKTFTFEAAHSLPALPEGHKCRRPHGHSYRVTLVLRTSGLDDYGFVRDYGELHEFRSWIDAHLDHRDLNTVLPVPTTAEHLARLLYGVAAEFYPETVAVRVQETATTYAEYRPDAD
jgi:6-pyruvoyltetrahydropterin/6-carboxytetrahydropterin synthase